eukprot:gb/GFBE01062893.1/.p1 GENE.gb/GFBE01062893.1/~~gb/GFBE01062893.1/.p1  ORF type:complete len:623 (+),score=107.36 gb/GFBE01062893.1/:1-1869(+)
MSCQVGNICPDFRPQELANTAWAFATMAWLDFPLLDAVSEGAQGKICEFVPQDCSNLAWSFAVLRCEDPPLFDALSSQAVKTIWEFEPQHLVNTAWAFATLRKPDRPLLTAVAAASIHKASDVRPDGLATLAWSFARLARCHGPLFDLVASRAAALLQGNSSRSDRMQLQGLDDDNVGMLLEAFSKDDVHLSRALNVLKQAVHAGHQPDGQSLGCLAGAARRRARQTAEVKLLTELLPSSYGKSSSDGLRAVATAAAARKLATSGDAEGALILMRQVIEGGGADPVVRQLWVACGGDPAVLGADTGVAWRVRAGSPYSKELLLLHHVLSTASAGDVVAVCDAVESFGEETLPGQRRWLKVAGGDKAQLLTASARKAPRRGLALEVGAYCGYSAARVAESLGPADQHGMPRMVTMEADLAHAVIAQHVLSFAGLSHVVEVMTGHSEDMLPWLVKGIKEMQTKAKSKAGIDFAFLDQRGSRYEADIEVLQQADVLSDRAVLVADNVLKPGAPKFLWKVVTGKEFETKVVSLPEFAMQNVEDWMTVSTFRRGVRRAPRTQAPREIIALEFRAEAMRERTHLPRVGGAGVDFTEWAEFSQGMRRSMCEVMDLEVTSMAAGEDESDE